MIIFYTSSINNKQCTLEEDEFIHCCKVLRHKIGDHINVTNGQGIFAEGEIVSISKKNALVKLFKTETKKPDPYTYHLAVAPPKNRSRWEMILEKSVEIGVDYIIPIVTKNSERIKLNIDRGNKIIRSAALQSKRITHPKLYDLIKFEKLIQDSGQYTQKFIAHYDKCNSHILEFQKDIGSSIIVIGPEGDFTSEEKAMAHDSGFFTVNISENRLRTETAALVGVNLLINQKTNES